MNNKKRKIIIVILLVNSIILVGCSNRNYQLEVDDTTTTTQEEIFDAGSYNKEVDKYTLTTKDNTKDISLSLAKELNYKGNTSKDYMLLENSKNSSYIKIKVLHTTKDDKEINKNENDYNRNEYYGYSKVEIDKLKGWQIFQKKDSNTNYELYNKNSLLKSENLISGKTHTILVGRNNCKKKRSAKKS